MLVLVVGPSGAGKDTLIDAARIALAQDARFFFVRRVVTRPAAVGDEQHEHMTEKDFLKLQQAGGFALSWRALGLHYGIPATIALELQAGRTVVANVSRALVAEAAGRFPTRAIEVTAPAEMLARRLLSRGREDAMDLARRMVRGISLPWPVEKETVVNDGTVEQGTRRMVAALTRAASAVPPAGTPPPAPPG